MVKFIQRLKGRQQSAFGYKNPKPRLPVIPEPLSRNDRMKEMRANGMTYQAIADTFDVSVARAQQIVKKETTNG